jgi:hypothetical protein
MAAFARNADGAMSVELTLAEAGAVEATGLATSRYADPAVCRDPAEP